ncbi:hypothetical protein AB5N19_06738 [Seiridium cardinale]
MASRAPLVPEKRVVCRIHLGVDAGKDDNPSGPISREIGDTRGSEERWTKKVHSIDLVELVLDNIFDRYQVQDACVMDDNVALPLPGYGIREVFLGTVGDNGTLVFLADIGLDRDGFDVIIPLELLGKFSGHVGGLLRHIVDDNVAASTG